MRVLVVGNAADPGPRLAAQMAAWADKVVAADGGAQRWRRSSGNAVDLVVGDLDSVSDDELRQPGPQVEKDLDPDTTDLDKALARAVKMGAAEVRVVGVTGGGSDHQLGVWASLATFEGRVPVAVWEEHFEVRAVRDQWVFDSQKGAVVSIFALGGPARVSTEGLRWPLGGAPLDLSSRGVHNEALGGKTSVVVAEGRVLVFRGRRADASV